MNWSKSSSSAASVQLGLKDERNDRCSHVEKDPTTAVVFRREMDSFGTVSGIILCTACESAAQEAEDGEIVKCRDCGANHRRENTHEWRWYDFYAPQGDEPKIICKACWRLPKHVERMAQDRNDESRDRERCGH